MSATTAPAPASKSGTKICVGCKLPHGLILELDRLSEEKGADGAVIRKFSPFGERVTLNGANSSGVIGGYGITEDVDADFFDAWIKQKADHQFIRQNLVFAMPSVRAAQDKAKEQAGIKSGFEPLDANKPAPGIERVPA